MSHAIINGFERGEKPVPKFWLVTRVARVFKTNHRVPEVKHVHDAQLRNKGGGGGGEELTFSLYLKRKPPFKKLHERFSTSFSNYLF